MNMFFKNAVKLKLREDMKENIHIYIYMHECKKTNVNVMTKKTTWR